MFAMMSSAWDSASEETSVKGNECGVEGPAAQGRATRGGEMGRTGTGITPEGRYGEDGRKFDACVAITHDITVIGPFVPVRTLDGSLPRSAPRSA